MTDEWSFVLYEREEERERRKQRIKEQEEYSNTFLFRAEKLIAACSTLKTGILKLFSAICFRIRK